MHLLSSLKRTPQNWFRITTRCRSFSLILLIRFNSKYDCLTRGVHLGLHLREKNPKSLFSRVVKAHLLYNFSIEAVMLITIGVDHHGHVLLLLHKET